MVQNPVARVNAELDATNHEGEGDVRVARDEIEVTRERTARAWDEGVERVGVGLGNRDEGVACAWPSKGQIKGLMRART